MELRSLHNFNSPTVVLLHGLGRTFRIMNRMESHLRHLGYNVLNVGYPSTRCSVKENAELVFEKIKHLYDQEQPLHFVTHSMGSIVLRVLLAHRRPQNLSRVVMLAPPNHGTKLVHWLRKTRLFQKVYGPASLELAADKNGIWRSLPPVNYELGVIAGNRAVDLLFWLFLDKPNDGKVTAESAKLDGMKDFLLLPVAHPFFPRNKHVRHYVAHFLEKGIFGVRPLIAVQKTN